MYTRLKFHEFVNGHYAPTRDVTVDSIFFVLATGVPFVKGRLTPRFRRIPNTEKEGQPQPTMEAVTQTRARLVPVRRIFDRCSGTR